MKYLITIFVVLLPVFCKAQGGLWCLCNQERKHYEKTLISNSYKIDSIAKEARHYSDSATADASYFVRIKGKNGWGVVNKYVTQVVPFQYDHLSKYFEDGYFYASYKGRDGLIDTGNNVIIPFGQFEISVPESYSFVPFFNVYNGFAVVTNNGMKGLVDKHGRKILPCIYQSITSIGDSMLGLKINGRYGIADCSGKVIMPPQFDELGYFQNGHVKVTKDSLVGLVNKKGRFVLPCRYSYLRSLKSGLIQVIAGDKCAYASSKGELLTPFIYELAGFTDWRPAGDFSDMYEGRDGMERVKRNDKWGYINSLGKEVVPCQYDGVKTLGRGSLVGVLKDKKWGYADYNGKLVIPCRYHWINEFDEGLALVMKDCNLSKAGKQCECQDFTHYEHGLRFAVYRPGIKYYIDSTGREVIRGDFQEAFAFEHGYAWMQEWSGRWKKIDTKGRTASTYKYTAFFWPRDNGLAAVMRNRKYGFVNNAGREVIPCIYDDACKFEGDTAMVQKNGKCLVINSKGKVLREL